MLRFEPLEDRRLLAVLTVDSLADGPVNLADGNTTLRDALALAADAAYPGADEITFAASLGLDVTAGEIELTEGELVIDSNVTIAGPGASQLAIDADVDDDGMGESRVFYVNSGVIATLDGVTISGGYADSGGGGYCALGSQLVVLDCVVSNNLATSYGGGIYARGSSTVVTLVRSSVLCNSTNAYDGGGIYGYYATVNATNATFSGNLASRNGGAIYTGSLTMTNSVLSGNVAGRDGGGIYAASKLSVVNSTLSANSAEGLGSGIFSDTSIAAVNNSILWQNPGENIYGNVEFHANLIDVDPRFVRPPSDGGDGWGDNPLTPGVDESVNDDYGDLGLTDLSPAIDYGSSTALLQDDHDLDGDGIVAEPIPLDIRGYDRVFGLEADCGAYEFQGNVASGRETPSLVVGNASNTFDLYDGDISLREAVYYAGTLGLGSTITFDSSMNNANIRLGGHVLWIGRATTVDASSLDMLTIDGEGTCRVLNIASPADEEVELIGVTITGGLSMSHGGGIRNFGSFTITDSTVTGNSASQSGVSGTAIYSSGGGIHSSGSLTVNNTTISGNTAPTLYGRGGGIACETAVITDSAISGNNSTDAGGGISGDLLAITDSTISGNSARAGGGMVAQSFTITNSTLTSNTALNGPGGAISARGTGSIVNSNVSGNSANGKGGGIDFVGNLTISNSLVSDNSSTSTWGDGGGVYMSQGGLWLVGATVSDNSANRDGGGLYFRYTSTEIYNSLIAANTAARNGPDVDGALSTASAFNLVGDGSDMTGVADGVDGNLVGTTTAPIDPLLVDAGGGNYRLLPGSPALDAGSNLYLDEIDSDTTGPDQEIDLDGSGVIGDYILATDLAGGLRVVNSVVDIGAYEGETNATQELLLDGTADANVVSITVTATEYVVTFNGDMTAYARATYNSVYFNGLGGTDQLTVLGTDENEIVTLEPGTLDLIGQTYAIHATSVEDITVDAGAGDDEVALTGSTGSNRLYSYPDRVTMSDAPWRYSYRAERFETVTVDVPGSGQDYAFLYDGPGGDAVAANPDQVVLTLNDGAADETQLTANGFQRVYAYSTAGGTDTALLTGSATAANRFYSYDSYSILTDSTRAFYFYARGFGQVTANSPSSLASYAYIYDSSAVDTFSATPTAATMDRAEPAADAYVNGFQRVYAYSTQGGEDRATLTGATGGGNVYRGYPTYNTLTDTAGSSYHYVRGFSSVTAIGSEGALTDRAYLYDSSGNDTFDEAFDQNGLFRGGVLTDAAAGAPGTYENWVKYFDFVYARSTDTGTTDSIAVEDEELLAYDLIRLGTW